MKSAIIGIGNPLWGDDGLGIHMAQNPPPDLPVVVDVIDGGTSGIDLLRFWEEYDYLIILDSVRHGGEPGDLVVFKPGTTGEIQMNTSPSAHGLDLAIVLSLAGSLGYQARVVVIGCEPGECTAGEGLSAPVKKSIMKIWGEVHKQLQTAICFTGHS